MKARATCLRGVFLALSLAGCGYAAVHGAKRDVAPLPVVLVESQVSDALVGEELRAGVRDALAREGLLGTGTGYPRVEVEILRIDRSPLGIAAQGDVPQARGFAVIVTGRAWIATAKGAYIEDTGDVRAETPRGASGGGASEIALDVDASRSAARRLGRILGRRLLGEPAPSEEGLGEP